jgi:FtsZ-binding cell division protein ZapB
VKNNPEDSTQDMIIKVFETVSHDLRLRKERVENLENEDIEKTKTIDTLRDQNDHLSKTNHKMQKRLDDQ